MLAEEAEADALWAGGAGFVAVAAAAVASSSGSRMALLLACGGANCGNCASAGLPQRERRSLRRRSRRRASSSSLSTWMAPLMVMARRPPEAEEEEEGSFRCDISFWARESRCWNASNSNVSPSYCPLFYEGLSLTPIRHLASFCFPPCIMFQNVNYDIRC